MDAVSFADHLPGINWTNRRQKKKSTKRQNKAFSSKENNSNNSSQRRVDGPRSFLQLPDIQQPRTAKHEHDKQGALEASGYSWQLGLDQRPESVGRLQINNWVGGLENSAPLPRLKKEVVFPLKKLKQTVGQIKSGSGSTLSKKRHIALLYKSQLHLIEQKQARGKLTPSDSKVRQYILGKQTGIHGLGQEIKSG